MRKDHFSPPAKWTKEFRQAVKLSHLHLCVYAYLEGGPESHRTGIYFVTVSAVAEMVIADRDQVEQAIEDLEGIGLIHWDKDADIVWIPCVCAEQFRWSIGTGSSRDNKTTEGQRHIASLPKSRLVDLFLANWPVFREGASGGAKQGALEGAPYTTTCTNTEPSLTSSRPSRPHDGNGGDA